MKKGVLEDLFYGNIEPMDIKSELSDEVLLKGSLLFKNENSFSQDLSKEKEEEFEELTKKWLDYNLANCSHYFIVGFKLGAKMMKDILEEDK
ncbi:hypothetical protein ANASTE_00998 [Anaerofustis stercorihominis DSM 17244]|uniref:Uncharacterized protein n=1 Tax=Anaerofustis stercorihominis DSM 17244 TaxID=445971 RepID=B1C8E1_9FIRM|nr:DUF6809 family protein [Anaerofustis stercorihominis]EDS73278.1 hypothetical protein ANASTE_00998 [Anaerofustis stercorihominis DSM 17244]